MSELLAPAGSMDSFFAATSNGADAIYFGLNLYSARAYANNFTLDECKFIVNYAHLRNIKVYCTMNTILLEKELEDAYKTVDELAKIGVDGIIVQDLALINYITENYASLEAHISTQVGIDDLDGIKYVESLGAKRVVLAREVSIDKIKEFKKLVNIEIETFIHGALCVSYSGNCFWSGLIGLRSGNRGRCVGCCRKLYALKENDQILNKSYLYSMRDLNTSKNIEDLKIVDSLKIEGRMKEPSYVAGIVRYYRNILDGKDANQEDLLKNFQRTFTNGYILNESPDNITNIDKPNNFGFPIGKVEKIEKGKVIIKLTSPVNQFDQIRIGNYQEEISYPLVKIYDNKGKLLNSSDTYITIFLKEKVKVGDIVYKTKDVKYLEDISKTYPQEFKRLPLDINVLALINKPLTLSTKFNNLKIEVKSDILVSEAINHSVTLNNFNDLLSKLNDTPYVLNKLNIKMDNNIFIPLKIISNLKRELIDKLNEERTKINVLRKEPAKLLVPKYELKKQQIACEVETIEQYNACLNMGIDIIYYKNKVLRNNSKFVDDDYLLVGGLNSLEHYNDKSKLITDYSLNIVNSDSLALLLSQGVKRVTLSYELSEKDINELIEGFVNKYNTLPNLEMIVYGRQKLLHSKYCPLKRLGMCGKCKTNKYEINDGMESFPLMFNNDCTTFILNSKTLNLIDELNKLNKISVFRLSFTIESGAEVKDIINKFKNKLNNNLNINYFDSSKDTRGYFFREIM